MKWRAEIESYFQYRVSNAPMEGTNNKIKVLKRRAYGYSSMRHFETRIRMECKSA
ncbi:transposase [Paenibacillus aurantius]|uniref:Transposase n=1 Tax=Paenibacillus aurantius TaxID=2918900 RepID=A0AA96RG66_9BACL|nr:transposase [Paenibacillus aurantius]WNQ12206.1 transposase [Paenibacillus aurantius]